MTNNKKGDNRMTDNIYRKAYRTVKLYLQSCMYKKGDSIDSSTIRQAEQYVMTRYGVIVSYRHLLETMGYEILTDIKEV